MPMSFGAWCRQFKQAANWASVRGNTRMLRLDYEAGMSPERAAVVWAQGYDDQGAAFQGAQAIVGRLIPALFPEGR